MKSVVLKFAAVASLGLASIMPAQAATTFKLDTNAANTFVNYNQNQAGHLFSASLATLPLNSFTLNVGESWTFDFIDISIGKGFGGGIIDLTSQLAFLTPGGSTPGSADGWYGVLGKLVGGVLTWDSTGPVTVGGATYLVEFENLAGFDIDAPLKETISATVTLVSEVPEPQTWAMMIAGFGLVGASLRLRAPRRTTARAA